ncbi:transposase [Streptomyces sp. NPDC005728]|uniref:transposase n=1 Tax=Streptomyces sp. NPDC005728 TaxID=3157054 RepID=UPI0033E525C5
MTEGEAFRYRRLQQRLARHKRGSTNRHKTITAMGRIMSRVTDRRGEFCAQAAAHPAQMNALIALEDLRIKNMPASAAGTLNEPGRRVAQKRGPNQDFGVVGWYPVHDDPSGGKPWE